MQLTADQAAALGHVVLDPQAWLDHAEATFGPERAAEMLAAKVERHRPAYLVASAAPGYKTRAEREAENAV